MAFWEVCFQKNKKNFSVPIHRVDVLSQRLLIVARLTQALPVGPVPEQLLVSTMGCNVVDHSGFRVSALFHAFSTQRMGLKELLGFPLPSAAVAALTRRTGHLWMERHVFLTVLLAGFHQGRTSRLLTWNFRSVWHSTLSFSGNKKSRVGIPPPRLCSGSSTLTSPRGDLPCQSGHRHSRGYSRHREVPGCR